MGRRKLLPNINNLLLQLHLPHRNNGSEANESKEIPEDSSSSREGTHFRHNNVTTHLKHNNLHVFTWPSLKRRPSLASNSSEDDDDHENHINNDNDTETEPSTSNRSLLESSNHTTCNNNLHSNSHKSVVSFGNCEIRTYTQVLGDHPCCSEGCPIQLGWSYTSEESIKVDDYERFYHTIKAQGEGGLDNGGSVPVPKYTVLHELRLTPEERRSILILSKQQEYVNANTIDNAKDNHDNNCRDISGSDEDDHCDSSCDSISLSTGSNIITPTPVTTMPQTGKHHHERELMRECRRLNRCGGWNVNVKASRKRNKRNQEAFFGSPIQTSTTTTTTTTTRIPYSNATTPAEL